ncbi:rod-binding protein [Roseivivax sp. CAU 1753]
MSDSLGLRLSPFSQNMLLESRRSNFASSTSESARVAREFETAFLAQGVDQMLKTADAGAFGGGHAEEMWRSFLAKAVADKIAETASTGVAAQIERAMSAYDLGGKQ